MEVANKLREYADFMGGDGEGGPSAWKLRRYADEIDVEFEKLTALEMQNHEAREWEGEILAQLENKGYKIRKHGEERCYSCTISTLISTIPERIFL